MSHHEYGIFESGADLTLVPKCMGSNLLCAEMTSVMKCLISRLRKRHKPARWLEMSDTF